MFSESSCGNQPLNSVVTPGNYLTVIRYTGTLCQFGIGKIQTFAQRILGQQAATIATYLSGGIALCTMFYGIYKAITIIHGCCNRKEEKDHNEKKTSTSQNHPFGNWTKEAIEEGEEHYIDPSSTDQFEINKEDFKICIEQNSRQNLIRSLDAWFKDPKVTGDKTKAYHKILEAFVIRSTELYLTDLNLNTLPACIGQLSQLQKLYLSDNNLTSIPKEIGQLSQLQKLDLIYNKLSSIPQEIGQLSQLRELNLAFNELTSIPQKIGQLLQLQKLYLSYNKLTIIPQEIGQLLQLQKLSLGNNELSSIPQEIGQLSQLQDLNIWNNPNLTEIPLSLGQIPGLTYISFSDTQVPSEMIDAILACCLSKREGRALENFPNQVNAWLVYGEHKMSITEFEKLFEDYEKKTIAEWLFRLEKTNDYRSCQQKLAKAVCGILQTLTEDDDEFKKLFFDQVGVNNMACHDRAAMAFNELYVAWRIHTVKKEATTKEKIEFMVQAAKTTALHKVLSKKIDIWELANKQILNESVETYLYYETSLQKELGLLTVIERMSYGQIGKRDWIDPKILVNEVNDSYLDALVDIPIFQKLMEKEESFQEIWKSTEKTYDDDYDLLEQYTNDDIEKDKEFETSWKQTANKYFENAIYNDWSYNESLKNVGAAKKKAKVELLKTWLEKALL